MSPNVYMNSPALPCDLLLRRHALVTLTAVGWDELIARHPDLQLDSAVTHWAAQRWPLVVRRPMPDESGVPLGMPLPPAAGKRRVSLQVSPDAIAGVRDALLLSEVGSIAPRAWQSTLEALQDLSARLGIALRVFGSLAWQALTGECYLSQTSDLDVLFPVTSRMQMSHLLDGIASIEAHAPMRIDGECVRADGAGVNWRELYSGQSEVMMKTSSGVVLEDVRRFIEEAV
jgi:phosphoribosyl-dephospho-CoA transferase